MSVSSDEINILIQRYLQELGYNHSAFAFGSESKIPQKEISKREIQPGALVYLIQKGIIYAQMEAAAENSVNQPASQFSHQLNLLRASLHQSTEIVDELCASTRRMKVFPTSDQSEPSTFYLNSQSSLFLEGHTDAVLTSGWSPDDQYLATASADGSLIIWRFFKNSSGVAFVNDHPSIFHPMESTQSAPDITSLGWSLSSNILACGTYSGQVIVYEVNDQIFKEKFRFNKHVTPIVSVSISSSGETLISGSSDGKVTLTNLTTQSDISEWTLDGELMDALFLDSERAVAAAGSVVYLLKAGEESTPYCHKQNPIVQILLDPSGLFLAIAENTGNVTVLDKEGKERFSQQIHQAGICTICWSQIPHFFAAGCVDGSVKFVNFDKENAHHTTFEGHGAPAYSIAVDPRGRFIASIDAKNVNIWSIEKSNLAFSYTCMEKPAISLNWSGNGRFLSIALQTGQVAVVDFDQLY